MLSEDEEEAGQQEPRQQEPRRSPSSGSTPVSRQQAAGAPRQTRMALPMRRRKHWSEEEVAALEEGLLTLQCGDWRAILADARWAERLTGRNVEQLRLKTRTEAGKRQSNPALRWGGWVYYLPVSEQGEALERDALLEENE